MPTPLKLMCIVAHPDDESLAMGGTLAKYAREGIETSLVVATRGERGWGSPDSENPGEEVLGAIREAASVLGVSHLAFLEYLDGDLDQAENEEVVPGSSLCCKAYAHMW